MNYVSKKQKLKVNIELIDVTQQAGPLILVWKQIVEEKKRNLKALEKEAADIQTAVAALKECEMTRDNTQS